MPINKSVILFKQYSKHIINFSSFLCTRLISIFAFAICVPFFIKHSSASEYGKVAIGFSLLGLSMIFDTAIGYVITLSIGRKLARTGKRDSVFLQGMFSVYIYFAILISTVFLSIVMFYHFNLGERIFYGSLALLFPFLSISGVVASVFLANNELAYLNFSRFGFELCKAVSLVISVLVVKGYTLIGPILLLGAIIRAMVDSITLKKYLGYSLKIIAIKDVGRYIKLALVGSYIFGSVIITLLVTIGDKLFIKHLISSDAVARYSFAFDLNAKAYILMNAINTTMYAVILRNHVEGKSKKAQIRIGLIGVCILGILYYLPMMIFSKKIITLLVSSSFANETSKLTSIMSCASLIYLFGNVFENAATAMGGARKIFYVYIVAIVVYFTTIFSLYKLVGIYGFMYAYLILCSVLCIGFIYVYQLSPKVVKKVYSL